MFLRSRTHEIPNGLLLENGSALFSGTGLPSVAVSDPEVGDFYLQFADPPKLFMFRAGTPNAWRQISLDDILFDPTNKSFLSTTVNGELVVDELRKITVNEPTTTATTLNETLTLTNASRTLQFLTGSATGYSVKLPDATTLPLGRKFEIANNSTQSVTIRLSDNTAFFTLIAGQSATLTLETNGTANGTWLQVIISTTAAGITSYSIGSETLFQTSSATDINIPGISVTPVAGRYALFYSEDIVISQNNRLTDVVVYIANTVLERTRRTVQGVSSNFNASNQTIAEVTVDGTQLVDIRVNISSGTVDITGRRLILIRLGSS